MPGSPPPSGEHLSAARVINHQLSNIQEQIMPTTASTVIHAAWALVMAQVTNSRDVVFDVSITGNTAVAGTGEIAGPAVVTAPMRIKLPSDQRISEYLRAVQQQATDMNSIKYAGLEEIDSIYPNCQQACKFQTLFVIQPVDTSGTHHIG